MQLIGKGAEADLFREGGKLIKKRIQKRYRIKELDEKIRKYRTRHEAKLMEIAQRSGISVPKIYKTDLNEKEIVMEFIDGNLVKDVLNSLSESEIRKLGNKIGGIISILHNSNIIHNDLTTSNMILRNNEVFLIDFGLGITSTRIEDRAMDLVVLKKSLLTTHPEKFVILWNGILDGYRKSRNYNEIMKRVRIIEKRVRYS